MSTEYSLEIINVSEQSAPEHSINNILSVSDNKYFQSKDPCKIIIIKCKISGGGRLLHNITLKNNGAVNIEIFVSEHTNTEQEITENNSTVLLPSTSLLKFSDIKNKTRFTEIHKFGIKQISRVALSREKNDEFKGWKQLLIKLSQPFQPFYSFGLGYLKLYSQQQDEENEDNNAKNNTSSLLSSIQGPTLEIPLLLSEDEEEEEQSSNPKELLENARKFASGSTSSAVTATSNVFNSVTFNTATSSNDNDNSTTSNTSKKKRTLPSGFKSTTPSNNSSKGDSQQQQSSQQSQGNNGDSDNDDSSKKKKKTTKTTKKKTTNIKFKALDLGGSDDDDLMKDDDDKKKKTTKKSTTKKDKVDSTDDSKKKKRKRKTKKDGDLSDPDDSEEEEEFDQNASDADDNGNLVGFVVSNRTVIKDDKKKRKKKAEVVDGPVTTDIGSILKGCIFAISGIQNPERTTIRETALQMGAKYRPDITKDITHVVTPFFSPNNDRQREAHNAGAQIVKKEWVYDCMTNSRRMNEKKYSLIVSADDDEEEEGSFLVSDDEEDERFEDGTDSEELDELDPDEEYVPKIKKRKQSSKQRDSNNLQLNQSTNQSTSNPPSSSSSNNDNVIKVDNHDIAKTDNNNIKKSPSLSNASDVIKSTSSSNNNNTVSSVITNMAPPVSLVMADEFTKELKRLKDFHKDSGMSKSFKQFIEEDVMDFAIACIEAGDIFEFFSNWKFKTPCPKFIKTIAKSAMDDDNDPNNSELIKKIEQLRKDSIDYIEKYLSNNSVKCDVKTDGPQKELPNFFYGCKVYFDSNVKNQDQLKRLIIAYGGEVIEDFNKDEITHVIVNPNYDGNTLYNNMRIVEYKWIIHSDKRQRKLNEEAYGIE
ncbi:hypothetical protein ABK040_015522 [Willaertia magna]